MGDFQGFNRFAEHIKQLGPQWREVDGTLYECYTPVRGSKTSFIATKPLDHRLFRVNLAINKVEPILVTNVPCGEVTPPEHHLTLRTVVKLVAEAWLRDEGPGIEHYAGYLVSVLTGTRLLLADELSDQLIALIGYSTGTGGEIAALKGDGIGSSRLRTAWVTGVVELVQTAVRQCPE